MKDENEGIVMIIHLIFGILAGIGILVVFGAAAHVVQLWMWPSDAKTDSQSIQCSEGGSPSINSLPEGKVIIKM